MKFEEWKKKNKPKKSKISQFRLEIIDLIKNDYSQVQIIDFLKTQGIETTQQNLSYWIKNNLLKKGGEIKSKSKKIDKATKSHQHEQNSGDDQDLQDRLNILLSSEIKLDEEI